MDRALYDVHNDLHETHWWFQGRKKIVRALLKKAWADQRFQSGIDLGTGGGSLLGLLREFIAKVEVLEPDEKIAQSLKIKYRDEVEVLVSTLENFNSSKKYQIVSLFDVLEHIEDDVRALEKIHSLLEPGGYIVLTVPAFRFLWSNHDVRAGHFRRYTKRVLVQKLIRAGFEVKRATYFNIFLFPVVYAVRFFHKFWPSAETDFSYGYGFGNWFFGFIFSLERLLVGNINFPFGVSFFCLALKRREK